MVFSSLVVYAKPGKPNYWLWGGPNFVQTDPLSKYSYVASVFRNLNQKSPTENSKNIHIMEQHGF